MAYDEDLAERIRGRIRRKRNIVEKKMFGGLAFMHRGHMAFGIVRDELMVRVGPDAYEDALHEPFAKEMDFTGRPMKGMVFVEGRGFKKDEHLDTWIERGLAHTKSLPPKA